MNSEAEIIKACIEGSRKHQKMLYDKYSGRMLGICMRYFSSLDQAEDALQEGFIRVFSNLASFRGEGSLEGWIKRTIVNTALNHFRNNKKHLFHLDVDEIGESMVDLSVKPDQHNAEDLLRLLHSLPAGYKIVFNLYEVEGYSHKEIADKLGISVNTSKSQLSKARRLLQKKLEKLYTEKEFGLKYEPE
jgi:RNA polymerase sigma factor (sigma-70 family)